MRLRATTIIRNDHIMAELERLGWSQADLARAANVSQVAVSYMCRLRFGKTPGGRCRVMVGHAKRVAEALGLELEDVMPHGLEGRNLPTAFVSIATVPTERLLEMEAPPASLLLTSPEEAAETMEDVERLLASLTERQRSVIEQRFGLGKEPDEKTLRKVGKRMRVSVERVRQIEAAALNKMRHSVLGKRIAEDDSWRSPE